MRCSDGRQFHTGCPLLHAVLFRRRLFPDAARALAARLLLCLLSLLIDRTHTRRRSNSPFTCGSRSQVPASRRRVCVFLTPPLPPPVAPPSAAPRPSPVTSQRSDVIASSGQSVAAAAWPRALWDCKHCQQTCIVACDAGAAAGSDLVVAGAPLCR